MSVERPQGYSSVQMLAQDIMAVQRKERLERITQLEKLLANLNKELLETRETIEALRMLDNCLCLNLDLARTK